MIKLIVFDLDGVLADTENTHYSAVCDAVHLETRLSYEDIFRVIKKDGTTTRQKLINLQNEFDLFDNTISSIDKLKQEMVLQTFGLLTPNSLQLEMLSKLENFGYHLAIGSNSRRENVNAIINALKIGKYFSPIMTIENVFRSKPYPEIFTRIMDQLGFKPTETLILEDSPSGQAAAISSGAHLLKINSCDETNLENILYAIKQADYSSADGRNGVEVF